MSTLSCFYLQQFRYIILANKPKKKKYIKTCKEPGHVDCRIRYVNHSLWAIYCGTRPIEREMIPFLLFGKTKQKGWWDLPARDR